jgi:cytochrome b6-f complex iron-sulfur subunit
MAEKKKMSVAEILAAARRADATGEGSAEPPAVSEEPVAADVSAEPAPGEAAPEEAATEPQLKPGERPSVADIMAMARGRGGDKAEKPAATSPGRPKPAAAAATARPAAKARSGPAKPAERMDTASILAAVRKKEAKRGPVSKAEAARLPAAKKGPAAKARPKPPAPKMPQRPVSVSPLPDQEAEADQGRRSLVFGAIFGTFLATGMTLLTATCGLWTLAFARFMFPNILTEPPSKFKIGFPDSISPGTVETKFKAQFGVWVVNYEFEGQPMIYALSTVCTHLGCTPNWLDAEQKFKCPCHGSGFYKDGVNFEGPAPRPLERYAIRVANDGQLEIDKSQKFQEEMGQWEDTASYVPV